MEALTGRPVAAATTCPARSPLAPGNGPPGAAGTLRSHLSRPRTLVGPDAALIARGGGYALAAGPEQLDAGRFGRL